LSGEALAPISGPGIPLSLAGLMSLVALQTLLCARGVVALSRSGRAELPPAASLRHLLIAIALAIALSVTALVVLPASNDVDWLGLVQFAPDAAVLLLAVVALAVLYAALQAATWLRAPGKGERAR
jgi:hypothetical protein